MRSPLEREAAVVAVPGSPDRLGELPGDVDLRDLCSTLRAGCTGALAVEGCLSACMVASSVYVGMLGAADAQLLRRAVPSTARHHDVVR
jgi:hypothetical protein